MDGWKPPLGPTCKSCLNALDETHCTMITPNGHGTPLKNPHNLTAGNGFAGLVANGHSKGHHHPSVSLKPHLDLVKDSLCCLGKKHNKKKQQQPQQEQEAQQQEHSCGLLSFKPSWLQPLANKKVFLAVFCLTSVLQGMYYTYFVSVLTTIEKLYQIQSKTTGVIMSATEIGQIGGALLLTYYGGQGHRPKWIACGMMVFAVASMFCATPHFLYSDITGPGVSSEKEPNATALALTELRSRLCQRNFTMSRPFGVTQTANSLIEDTMKPIVITLGHADVGTTTEEGLLTFQALPRKALRDAECEQASQSGLYTKTTHTVLIIFFVSLLLIGIGATAVYTLGIPYIDDNVATRESPLYFGITIGVRIFGPVFGFLLGSFCTSVYINFPFETSQLSTDDPQWLGAWWLGVIIVGIALIFTSFPMMAFPRNLPHPIPARLHHKNVIVHVADDIAKLNGNSNGTSCDKSQCHTFQPPYCGKPSKPAKPSLKDFPSSVWRLLQNKILVLRTASSVLHILPIAGLYTFLPKYLESQFQLTATMANMITGLAGILVMGLGIFASGTFMRKYKPNARFVARWIALSALAYAIGMIILMWFGCPLNNYVGLNAGKDYDVINQPTCNETCGCKSGEFSPICTSEGITYLSPCLAGCTEVAVTSNDQYIYKNCLCLGANVTATNGFCPLECNSLLPYVFIFSFFVLIHSTSEVGSMLLTLRCVEPKDKAMALGLIAFAIGLFGNVPCPIIYGIVVDSACLFWEDHCGEPGACRIYDPSKFRTVFHGVTAIIMLMAFVVDSIVWYKAKSIQFEEEDVLANVEEAVPFNESQNSAQESCL